ncbi:MAG: hypothetical protein ACYSW3_29630 [Planctomycetota bacterium]|jgi:hypothetical protein
MARQLNGNSERISIVIKSDDWIRYKRLCKKNGIKQIDMFSILLDKKLNKLEYAFTIISKAMAELDIARGEIYKVTDRLNILLSDSDIPSQIPLWDIIKRGK